MTRIDAHQHYWELQRRFPAGEASWFLGAVGYPWREAELLPLDRDFLPPDLEPELEAAGIGGTILINVLHSLGETEWMLGLAGKSATIRGVVGWADLTQPTELLEASLERLLDLGPLVGIRHLAEFEPDQQWLLRPQVVEGLKVLASHNLVYDLLLQPPQLALVPRLAEQVPELTFVIDHLAKPPVRNGEVEPWATHLRAAAASPNTLCKLSGLVTEADHSNWTTDGLLPYVEVALEAFSPQRLMYGSDWPVCTIAASYTQVIEGAAECIRRVFAGPSPADEAAIFGATAERAYGLAAT